ncbi:MAG: ABC transporter ATP-binding protein [Janthinobacterium lividum]
MSAQLNPPETAAQSSVEDFFTVRNLHSLHAGPFSFTLAAGECLVVRGPSGAGKSLLLRMLADLDPNLGDVRLDGVERGSVSAPAWRRMVVFQGAKPAWWETTAAAHFTAPQRRDTLALLPLVGLDGTHLEREITLLSTGERQRMALVRSLVNHPRVLLLDEPTAALDQASVLMVETLLQQRLETGLAIVLVTHSLEQAVRMGDRELRIGARMPS